MTDRYVPTAVGTPGSRYQLPAADGATLHTMMVTFEKLATDTDASVIRFARGFCKQQIRSLRIENDALTGATDINVGIYKGELGAVKDDNAFADALDIAAGNVIMSGVRALTAVALSDRNKSVQELAGDTKGDTMPVGGYDLAITGVTLGTATGTINIIMDFIN